MSWREDLDELEELYKLSCCKAWGIYAGGEVHQRALEENWLTSEAIKAGVQPVRVVRHQSSIDQYGKNYFGDTNDGATHKAPFSANDLQKFYRGSVGVFGESIYPLIWDGPPSENGPD